MALKVRNLTQFQSELDGQMAWRIREISDYKLASKARTASVPAFVRGGVALVYAHWEGFIKAASETYLSYVQNQGLIYRELKTCFVVFGLKGHLNLLGDSRKAISNISALDFVLNELDKPSKMSLSTAINTESNLTSKVFANIATSIGISMSRYETHFNLIDESLVRRRNSIAHGEYLDLEPDDFRKLADDVIQLMRWFKSDLENAASLQSYKRLETA